jgi:membrane protein DedA with SNARE-associated domain
MGQMMIDIINSFGYIGIAFLIAVENIFPPIPSEVILTFGGFLTTASDMNVWGVILSATIGSVAGALILYYLGRLLNAERLERLFESKLGKRLRLKKEDVRRAEGWFSRHGNKTVFFCRFIPLVRSLISIPAGAAEMKMGVFLLLTTTGSVIWNVVLVFLGKFAGDAWGNIADYVNVYSLIAVGILAMLVIAAGVVFIKKRFLKERGDAGKDDTNESI